MHRRTLRLAIGLLALLTLPGAVAAPRGRTITVSRSEAPLTSAWLGHAGPLALGAGNVSPRATSGRRPGGGPASAARLVAAADPQWSSRCSWGIAGPVGSVDALAYMGTDLYV